MTRSSALLVSCRRKVGPKATSAVAGRPTSCGFSRREVTGRRIAQPYGESRFSVDHPELPRRSTRWQPGTSNLVTRLASTARWALSSDKSEAQLMRRLALLLALALAATGAPEFVRAQTSSHPAPVPLNTTLPANLSARSQSTPSISSTDQRRVDLARSALLQKHDCAGAASLLDVVSTGGRTTVDWLDLRARVYDCAAISTSSNAAKETQLEHAIALWTRLARLRGGSADEYALATDRSALERAREATAQERRSAARQRFQVAAVPIIAPSDRPAPLRSSPPSDLPGLPELSASMSGTSAYRVWDGGSPGAGNYHDQTQTTNTKLSGCTFSISVSVSGPSWIYTAPHGTQFRMGNFDESWTGSLSDVDPDSVTVVLSGPQFEPRGSVLTFKSKGKPFEFTTTEDNGLRNNDEALNVNVSIGSDLTPLVPRFRTLVQRCSGPH